MKHILQIVTTLAVVTSAMAQGPYRTVTIRDIQQNPIDSLLLADQLQNSQTSRWTLQASPFYRATAAERETVEVVAQVIVPPKVITFTASGWTMLLRDTGAISPNFAGVLARANVADSNALLLNRFLNVERGDVIRLRGWVDEFPSSPLTMNSATQFVPVPGVQIDIIDSRPLPVPPLKTARDFYEGIATGGKVKYSTGEPFEGQMVTLTGLTVVSYLNQTNGTFNMVDDAGNMISMLDVSKWFTLRAHRDLASTYALPPINARIDTIRGYLSTNSGSENIRGYRICPVYPGDIVIGITLPALSTHRREPIVVSPTDTARISVRSYGQFGGYPLRSVLLRKSINNAPFMIDTMRMDPGLNDSTYRAVIEPQAAGTFVKYYVTATDTAGNTVTLANSGFSGVGADTSQGFFFYTVLDRPLTIRDIQWTPFRNGRSAYIGAAVALSGIVTADTSDLRTTPISTSQAGTTAWYIQANNEPWNGIWVAGPDSTLADLRKGDSITVGGTVQESFDVTRLTDIEHPVTVHATGRPVPAPVLLTTDRFGANIPNGDPSAEQWEGMLVRFNDVTVGTTYPTFADPTEFELTDGVTPVLVRRDGKHTFSNQEGDTSQGYTIVHTGDRFSHVQGIIYFGNNRYKFVPRGNADFGNLTSTDSPSARLLPDGLELSQNYPNPFNPTTTIEYRTARAGFVSLKVYNILGQEVATLVEQTQQAGRHVIAFHAGRLPSGVYLYRLTVDQETRMAKMMLIR